MESSFRMLEFVTKSTNINSEIGKVDWLVTSTIQAVLPARLNCHLLQMQQISSLFEKLFYLDKIILNKTSKIELNWWIKNLELSKCYALIQLPTEVLIQTHASKKGWGALCNMILKS